MEDSAGTPPLTRRQMRLAEQQRAQADAHPPEVDAPPVETAPVAAPRAEPPAEPSPEPEPHVTPPVEPPAPSPAESPAPSPAESPAPSPAEEDAAAPPAPAQEADAADTPDAPPARAAGNGSPDLPVAVEDPEEDDVRWDGPLPPVSAVRAVRPPGGGLTPAWAPSSAGAAGSAPGRGPLPPVVPPAEGAPDRPQPPAAPSPASSPASPSPTSPSAPSAEREPARDGLGVPALPTLDDLLARRTAPPEGPAQTGWRRVVRVVTRGLVRPAPGRAEQELRDAVTSVQRDFGGPRTIVVINPKGGAHKTTATLLLAATFGTHRGGYVLAWDNNETRGTMGWRTEHGRHHATAVDLLEDLERFEDPRQSRVGDLDAYVRSQTAQFDVLASDEDAASAASIDAYAFRSLHRTLSRFYRVMVVDTGNNMRASNWQAAVEAADQVVIVTTVREDTAQSAAWAADALRATGHEDKVRDAVTVLADPAVQRDPALAGRLHDHFSRLTRTVVDVPWDPALVSGGPLDVNALHRRTRESWLRVTAAVADGL